MHLQIFCIGGYHTTSFLSVWRVTVKVLYTIYIRKKKNCGPFCYETPDSFERISEHHLPSPSPTFDVRAHLLDSMTSFLKKPMVDATPRTWIPQDCPFQCISPKKFWEATTKHPNWLLFTGSQLLDFLQKKTEDLGCVLCKTKKDLQIKHTHTARNHTLRF